RAKSEAGGQGIPSLKRTCARPSATSRISSITPSFGSRAPTGRSRRQDARSEQIRATRFSHRMARKDSRGRDSMKLITRLGAFALAALIGSPLVLAQADKSEEAAPAKPRESAGPMPSAELKKVAYMAGDWTCTGKTFASPMGPEHPVEATVHARWQL